MVKLRITLSYEYDADPDDYDSNDPLEMAAIDEENMKVSPAMLGEMVQADLTGLPFELKVEPAHGKR